ncbi:MAG: SAM-dependent methyltransferase [Bacteroidota bacterium]
MDTRQRNQLSRMVTQARTLLTDEFSAQLQSRYGIQPDGTVLADAQLAHLSDEDYTVAQQLRTRLDHLTAADAKAGVVPKKARQAGIQRLLREQAFTILNRFAALRMGEVRGLIEESIAGGFQARAFQVFSLVAGSALGDTYARYRVFLDAVFDAWALDLGPLFDRFSTYGLLFPREAALKDLFALLNAPALDALWAEDETIGWIYQYYNDPDERKQMRKASAPRTSRELAVRNQFFTPRYVVEFLVDNTLGQLWYEMRRGETALADHCIYRVRQADEVFLAEPDGPATDLAQRWLQGRGAAEAPPSLTALAGCVAPPPDAEALHMAYAADGPEACTTHDLLALLAAAHRTGDTESYADVRPVLVERCYPEGEDTQPPHVIVPRAVKDPRTIRLLDPACGSMHFGLYAFDLMLSIYQEAWTHHRYDVLPDLVDELDDDQGAFLRQVPRMIVEHNIYGIDIDPRATQIAALALWLRAQRAWQQQGLAAEARPAVHRSRVVCAEPMPGEADLLDRFCYRLDPPVLKDLVLTIWDQMKLAGVAGSLLRIDDDLRDAVAEARKDYERWLMQEQSTGRDLFAAPQTPRYTMKRGQAQRFWQDAEARVLRQLRAFAEQQGGGQARLFAGDAVQGFAFIDTLRERFDVVVMNPPFGKSATGAKTYLDKRYPRTKNDLYAAFVEQGLRLLAPGGRLGAITSRTGFFLSSFQKWREEILLEEAELITLADLGYGVMDDAMVEAAAYVLETR